MVYGLRTARREPLVKRAVIGVFYALLDRITETKIPKQVGTFGLMDRHVVDVFAHAVNWKSYFKSHLSAFITGDILEVGAGIGTTTRILCDGFQRSRTCLEPDPSLVKRLKQAADDKPFALPVQITTGTLEDLAPALRFDTLLYIDVLEHIENDEPRWLGRRPV